MKIRFTKRHVVEQGDGKGPVYEEGKTYTFNGRVEATYAHKYITRGWAVDVTDEPAPSRQKQQKVVAQPIVIEDLRATSESDPVLALKEPWPPVALVSKETIEQPQPFISVSGNLLTITLSNAKAVYQIGQLGQDGAYTCNYVEGTHTLPVA